jgi:septum formation protein
LELLRQIVPIDAIDVLPPRTSDEAGFENRHDWPAIESRLVEIARTKCDDVLGQLPAVTTDLRRMVITADTIVVARPPAGRHAVLGQPPDDPSWRDVVRGWFQEHYAGKTHTVATALCVADVNTDPVCHIVKTEVTFHDDVERWLEPYLATGDSRGKAGGYGIQGAASQFVSRVDGSISNVIGLPLRELLEILAGFDALEL